MKLMPKTKKEIKNYPTLNNYQNRKVIGLTLSAILTFTPVLLLGNNNKNYTKISKSRRLMGKRASHSKGKIFKKYVKVVKLYNNKKFTKAIKELKKYKKSRKSMRYILLIQKVEKYLKLGDLSFDKYKIRAIRSYQKALEADFYLNGHYSEYLKNNIKILYLSLSNEMFNKKMYERAYILLSRAKLYGLSEDEYNLNVKKLEKEARRIYDKILKSKDLRFIIKNLKKILRILPENNSVYKSAQEDLKRIYE